MIARAQAIASTREYIEIFSAANGTIRALATWHTVVFAHELSKVPIEGRVSAIERTHQDYLRQSGADSRYPIRTE